MRRRQGFITPLRVESIDAVNWLLLEDFIWVGSKDDEFIVHQGEHTDFATVPWWTQSILPRTGTWTKAAVLHDKMCDDLNVYYKLKKRYDELVAQYAYTTEKEPIKPVFTSIDTDAIFRKNAREGGTDVIRSELLWMGVRYGALGNVARRGEFIKTAPRVLADTMVILGALFGIIALIAWIWP